MGVFDEREHSVAGPGLTHVERSATRWAFAVPNPFGRPTGDHTFSEWRVIRLEHQPSASRSLGLAVRYVQVPNAPAREAAACAMIPMIKAYRVERMGNPE